MHLPRPAVLQARYLESRSALEPQKDRRTATDKHHEQKKQMIDVSAQFNYGCLNRFVVVWVPQKPQKLGFVSTILHTPGIEKPGTRKAPWYLILCGSSTNRLHDDHILRFERRHHPCSLWENNFWGPQKGQEGEIRWGPRTWSYRMFTGLCDQHETPDLIEICCWNSLKPIDFFTGIHSHSSQPHQTQNIEAARKLGFEGASLWTWRAMRQARRRKGYMDKKSVQKRISLLKFNKWN